MEHTIKNTTLTGGGDLYKIYDYDFKDLINDLDIEVDTDDIFQNTNWDNIATELGKLYVKTLNRFLLGSDVIDLNNASKSVDEIIDSINKDSLEPVEETNSTYLDNVPYKFINAYSPDGYKIYITIKSDTLMDEEEVFDKFLQKPNIDKLFDYLETNSDFVEILSEHTMEIVFENMPDIEEIASNEEKLTEDKKQQEDIKTWYMKEYPDDELGEEIRPNLTSIEIFNLMKRGKDIYEILGGDSIDSIIRERVFEKMSDDLNIDYNLIYNLWLNN